MLKYSVNVVCFLKWFIVTYLCMQLKTCTSYYFLGIIVRFNSKNNQMNFFYKKSDKKGVLKIYVL